MIGCNFSLRGYRVLRKVEGRLVLVPAALFFCASRYLERIFLAALLPAGIPFDGTAVI